jgi:Spy/CpxP family protein refolding chaperone
MKKIILSVFALSMFVAVKAQEIPERKSEKPPMMQRKKHHGHGMDMKKLNLTEDQKAKFKSQNEAFQKKMEELKKNDGITVKEWKAKAEALRKEHKANTDNILTAEQKGQLEKMKVEGKQKREAMDKQRGEKMKAHLGLSDAQSAKMEANRKEMGEKMKAIRENKSLSEEQKKEQMKELHKKQKENMKSVLTEEQLKKLKESKHKRHDGEKKKEAVKETI